MRRIDFWTITLVLMAGMFLSSWPLAGQQLKHRRKAFRSSGPTYLVQENFILTTNTAPTGWGQSGASVTWNYDTAPAPLEPPRSLALNSTSNVTTPTFAATNAISLFFIFNPAATPSANLDFVRFSNGGATVATLQGRSSAAWRLGHGSINSGTLAAATGTQYFWLDLNVSSGTINLFISTDTTKGAADLTLTGGNGSGNINNISFLSPSATLYIIDKVRADDVTIGDNPS